MLLRRLLGGSSLILGMGGLLAITPLAGAPARSATPADTTKPGLPLTQGRTARFTTSRATWTSLDVSPDGQTIVFDMLGDLYRLPIAGGKATKLTSGLAYDAQPRWSPDGKRVVFVSDRSGGENLYTMGPDGDDIRQISPPGNYSQFISPKWTPDGKYVVVGRSAGFGTPKLWLYDIAGGTGLQLTRAPGPQAYFGPAFGPDGRYIYYGMRLGLWQYNAEMPQFQLSVYDRETGTRRPPSPAATAPASGRRSRPTASGWSTAPARLPRPAFELRELATGMERWLAYPVQRDDHGGRARHRRPPGLLVPARLEGDRRLLRRRRSGGSRSTAHAAGNIPFTIDAEVAVGPEVKFEYPIEDAPTFTVSQIRDPGRRPTASEWPLPRWTGSTWPICRTAAPKRVTSAETGEYYPAWSPDGASLAYVTWNGTDGEYEGGPTSPAGPGHPTHPGNRLLPEPGLGARRQADRRGSLLRPESRGADRSLHRRRHGGRVLLDSGHRRRGHRHPPDRGAGQPALHPGHQPDLRLRLHAGAARQPARHRGGPVSFRFDGTDLKQHLEDPGPLPSRRELRPATSASVDM